MLEEFFETHKSDLKSGYWTHSNVEEAIFATIEYAQDFEDALLDLSEKNEDSQLDGLETIFRPLSDSSYHIVHYNKSKARKNWLRIYALRLERDVYIVTGGAIKLTKKMQDREHTQKELFKIEKCRQYLIENNIVDVDGLIEEIEN